MSKNFDVLRNAGRPLLPPQRDPSPTPVRHGYGDDRQWGTADTRGSDFLALLRILRTNWRTATLTAAAIFGAVALATFLMTPVYAPTARVEVEPPGAETFTLERGDIPDPEWVDTQVGNLESDDLALATIRQLRLDRDADFAGKLAPWPSSMSLDTTHSDTDTRMSPAEAEALHTFKRRLEVTRNAKGHLIAVSVAAHDPTLAAHVTNALITTYIDRYYRTRYDAVMQSSQWLSRQLDDIRENMRKSNQALADYQQSTGIGDVDDKQSTVTQSLLELNRQLAAAQGERIQWEAYLGRISANGADSLPQVRDNPITQSLMRDLNAAQAELAQLQVTYGSQHPKVKLVRNRVEQLQAQLNAQAKMTVSQIRTSYEAARARERLLIGQLRDITGDMGRMTQYNALKKEAQANSDLYNALFGRLKEAGLAAASRSSNIRVVDRAQILDRPTRPRRLLNLALGFVFALVSGVVVGFAKRAMDTTVHSPEDITNSTGLPALTVVPMFQSETRALGSGEKFLLHRPNSPEAEAVRVLYASIMMSDPGALPRTLLIASPSPGDGKTTIATNLALALARRGTTCIVDADVRRKAVSSAFGITSHPGFADAIAGSVRLEDVLVSVPDVPGLCVLSAGNVGENAADILVSEETRDVLATLRSRFEFVVLDSPPILPYAEGRALAVLSDGVILVGRYRATTRDALNRTAQVLAEARVRILGFVLNGADLNAPDYRLYRYHDYERSA